MARPVWISDSRIRKLIDGRVAIRLAEKAFRSAGCRDNSIPSKIYVNTPDGDFRAMPAWVAPEKALGLKWICVYPKNPLNKLPSVIGHILMSNPKTGELSGILEANALTAWRTGGASALATSYLAKKDFSRLAVIGSGVQSGYQIDCHLALKPRLKVKIWSKNHAQSLRLSGNYRRKGFDVTACSAAEKCVSDADVIITVTPSSAPVLKDKWIPDGCHINAIGADAAGKQELEHKTLRRSKIIVDDIDQSVHSGEINTLAAKLKDPSGIICSTLTDVVKKKKRIRTSPGDITVFDSTGLAIQDMVFARYVLTKVR